MCSLQLAGPERKMGHVLYKHGPAPLARASVLPVVTASIKLLW